MDGPADAFEGSVGLATPPLSGERIGVSGEEGGENWEERGGVWGAAGGVAEGEAFDASNEVREEGERRGGGLKRESGSAEGDRAVGVEASIVRCCAS